MLRLESPTGNDAARYKREYTTKEKRQERHLEKGYEERGVPERESKRRAWATVNTLHAGGEKPGTGGYGRPENREPTRKGGRNSRRGSSYRTSSH